MSGRALRMQTTLTEQQHAVGKRRRRRGVRDEHAGRATLALAIAVAVVAAVHWVFLLREARRSGA